jgi:tRNA(Ile2)-agmatinylcytidine synthase
MLLIGFDDTDSREGKCTTYLAYRIVDFLLSFSDVKVLDYPLLVRLNPNIPWKTRGNGALCIKAQVNNESTLTYIKRSILNMFIDESCINSGANPALVFYDANGLNHELIEFSKDALCKVLSKKRALHLAEKYGMECYTFGNGQGIVGALAAIGTSMYIDSSDHTYEIIAYRMPENYGKPRLVDEQSVIAMDKSTTPYTFNNYDYKHRRVLITPHGPDPVLCGIRGEDPCILIRALKMLDIREDMQGYMIFKSNQGTNAHLESPIDFNNLKAYTSGYLIGRVASRPKVIEGGHTFFELEPLHNDANSIRVLCAVYEPTGLSALAQRLRVGDTLEVGGGVRKGTRRNPKVVNIEYIKVLSLAKEYIYMNPLCICGKRLKSEGKGKGYGCEYCGYRSKELSKVAVEVPRSINLGLYLPDPKAHRHLTKPLQRYYNTIRRDTIRFNPSIEWFCKFKLVKDTLHDSRALNLFQYDKN